VAVRPQDTIFYIDKENDNGTSSGKERRRLKTQRENGSQTDKDLFEADGDKI